MRLRKISQIILMMTTIGIVACSEIAITDENQVIETNGLNRSILGNQKTEIEFINKKQEPIKVFWMDYNGNAVFYKMMKPSEKYTQNTFMTHPWLITDSNNKKLDIYYPENKKRTIIIEN